MRAYRQSLLGLSCLTAAPGLCGPVLPAAAIAAAACVALPPAVAWAAPRADQAAEVRLAAGPLDVALLALAKQTGVQIVFTSQLVEGRQAPAVSGRLTAGQALERLIAGSDLEVQRAGGKVLVLRARGGIFSMAAMRGAGGLGAPDATLDPGQAEPLPPPSEDPTLLSEIVVGSHIRGVKDSASPVVVLSREDLDRAGHTTVADAMSALPQAFGGLGSEDTTATATDSTGTNASRATGVNLRGLGTDATLVLVNGRRLAGTGLQGDFADLSSIPMAAVDKIEVLLDGASALYGSDAVGGVVNVVLRKSFDGAETRLLGGGATRGGASQWSLGQTLGASWASGHVVAAYEHANRDRLKGRDRSFTGQADLRPFGGADHRRFYSSPGNILRADSTGNIVPTYAIPAGQSGVGLTPSSFLAGQANLENYQTAYDVLPRQRRDSLYVYLAQDLTPEIELSADVRATRRQFTTRATPSVTALTVTGANPYFVSPTGAASERIAYSFLRELGGQRVDGDANTLGLSLGALARLPRGWRLDAYGAYGLEESISDTTNLLNSSFLSEALGTTPDNPLSSFAAADSGYFNPFIGTGSNPKPILDFIGSGFVHRKTRGETASVNFKLDGTILRLPAGAVGLAVGGQIRREALKTGGESQLFGYIPTPITRRDVERTIEAAFAEVRAPLFGGDFVRPGLRRLELSAAVRREDYGHGLASTDPKIGVIWSPLNGATVKASYGSSFRAPALTELNQAQGIAPTSIVANGKTTIAMILYGGNPYLKPETATSKALTLEIAPPTWPRLKASATWFNTRFSDRIGQPGNDYITQVLTSPEFAPFVTLVSPTTSAADRARVQALIDDPRSSAQGVFPVESYGAIIDGRYVNTGALHVQGLDISASYAGRLGSDPLLLSTNLSWMIDYQRKITPASRPLQRAGFAGEPADLRARTSAAWTHGALTTTLSVTRVGDLATDDGGRVKAWTTADLNLRYGFTAGRLAGSSVALNVQNLFDSDPPFYDAPVGVGYDAANADPLGRVVTLQLTKSW